ncbi:hypothetical protein ILUMI_20308 [Ignelater luminosus]|uniref:Uncharacterized protein n=1 Tax=Ignelater luminosus TaxID=2038154 RepID=A0A8K0CIQ0_IGNLU|nr:hypothetical protein ILUMI_20308 [Ignelater luminosus]
MGYKRVPQTTLERYVRKKRANPDYAVLAEQNSLPHPFKYDAARLDWVRGFPTRHPVLSLRKPEANLQLLANMVDTDRIYNCDETRVSVNANDFSKIIAKTGRRELGALSSGERGETVTVEICFSATGNYASPILNVFRKRMKQEFETGLPHGRFSVGQQNQHNLALVGMARDNGRHSIVFPTTLFTQTPAFRCKFYEAPEQIL